MPSGRYQARYTGPDGRRYSSKRADGSPLTFQTARAAATWLTVKQAEIIQKEWEPPTAAPAPAAGPLTLREYADAWLVERELEIRTRDLYRGLLVNHIYPTFGDTALADITSKDVRTWYARLIVKPADTAAPSSSAAAKRKTARKTTTGATARSHAYALLRTVLNTAADDELIGANPCKIRGAGRSKRAKVPNPATVGELETIVKTMPAKYQLMVLLAAWCAPRFGELAELRCRDVDLARAVLRIRRSVARTARQGRVIKGPKSEAGQRDVDIPPHLIPAIEAHLADHAAPGHDGLLFPGQTSTGHMCEKTLYAHFDKARAAAGRTDLTWHGLRHTGATMASQAGASLKELMARLGHSTVAAAMIYQHVAENRGRFIAASLSELATGNVTPIADAPSAKKKSRRRPA